MNIREIFKNDVAKSAFQRTASGGTKIVGKYGELEMLDDVFDVYFVSPNREPLSSRRLTNIQNKLKTADIHRLDGEMWYQTKDESLARLGLSELGVKKSRRLSGEALEQARERMKKVRENISKN